MPTSTLCNIQIIQTEICKENDAIILEKEVKRHENVALAPENDVFKSETKQCLNVWKDVLGL